VDRLLKVAQWPDWKNRDNSYPSDSVLGWMWREMTQKMTAIESQQAPACQESLQILDIYSKCCNFPLLDEMEDQMETAIKDYIAGRKLHAKDSKEEFYSWQKKYCTEERIELIEERSLNPAADQSKLAAAVLYHQCIGFEQRHKNSNACEFAWLVAEDELLQIFSGKGSLSVSRERLPCLLRRN
jgi:hypothetical protein